MDAFFEVREPDELDLEDVCKRIERLTTGMMRFWQAPQGWAPVASVGLLTNAMLDEQASLSVSLARWIDATSPGDLILAWANLGALVEGQLKLLLSVYLDDYKSHAAVALTPKGKKMYENSPEKLMLAKLQQFCDDQVWDAGDVWDDYIGRVRTRRNAIHTFKQMDVGTFADWRNEVRMHLSFIRHVNSLLPYPDDMYEPREY